jgi:hypothetical protein
MIAGLLCAGHGLLCRPASYLKNYYRAGLLGLVVLGPVVLAVFPYNPTRYYVPIIPAYILLVGEWLYMGSWRDAPVSAPGWISKIIGFCLLFLLIFYAGSLVNEFILMRLPVKFGQAPGFSIVGMTRFVAPAAAAAAFCVFLLRSRLISKAVIVSLLAVISVAALAHNTVILSRFLVNPSYQSLQIQAEMEKIVAEKAIVAGGWAPFFLVGTKIRSLYLNDSVNRNSLGQIRPDYLLDNGNLISRANAEAIERVDGARLGDPVLRSAYIGAPITLYPVLYNSAGEN